LDQEKVVQFEEVVDMSISEYVALCEKANVQEVIRYRDSMQSVLAELSLTYKNIMHHLINNKKDLKKEEGISENLHRVCSIGNLIGTVKAKIAIAQYFFDQKARISFVSSPESSDLQ
jgi:hypothetical protein